MTSTDNLSPRNKSARWACLLSSATMAITGCEEKRAPATAAPAPAAEATLAVPSPIPPLAHSNDAIHTRVAREIAEILGKPASAITAEKDLFKDLGADSLDAVEIVMALEEEFDLTIDDAAAEKMSTVADIVEFIRNKKKP